MSSLGRKKDTCGEGSKVGQRVIAFSSWEYLGFLIEGSAGGECPLLNVSSRTWRA
jgi:hypothetical protein